MTIVSKEKNREYQRKWFRDNKEVQRERVKANQAAKRAWLREYKANLSCERCGEDHPATLDFHHRDPIQKEGNISLQIIHWSIERTLREIEKCEVLCSNCHRKLHWKES